MISVQRTANLLRTVQHDDDIPADRLSWEVRAPRIVENYTEICQAHDYRHGCTTRRYAVIY